MLVDPKPAKKLLLDKPQSLNRDAETLSKRNCWETLNPKRRCWLTQNLERSAIDKPQTLNGDAETLSKRMVGKPQSLKEDVG